MSEQPDLGISFTLQVAGIPISIFCDDLQVINILIHRYINFLVNVRCQFTVHLYLTNREGVPSLHLAQPIIQPNNLKFLGQNYQGEVNLMKECAHLAISSQQPAEEFEYFIRVIYSLIVFRAGGILLHAAGIVQKGKAYIFLGHSGSGKTTVARLSQDKIILSDDLVVLLPAGKRWIAHATPFWNPGDDRRFDSHAPTAGLYFLNQAKKVYLEPLNRALAVAETVSNIPIISSDPEKIEELLARCDSILTKVTYHRLNFLPDKSFWGVIDK